MAKYDNNCEKELRRFKSLKTQKLRWHNIYQLIGEYIHINKQDFQNTTEPGDFLTEQVYDSSGPKSMRQAAAAILSMVWSSAKSSMRINPHPSVKSDPDVKKYFEMVNDRIASEMDKEKAGMAIALEEYMLDQLSFGTSGLGLFRGKESLYLFKSYGIEQIYIDEGANGYVDTIYTVYEKEVDQAVEEWGLENLSSRSQDAFKAEKFDTKIKILHVIEPRTKYDKNKLDNKNMPIKSKYIEIDANHVIKESGFQEMPARISRFYKRSKEKYGRSPAMDALPDILELNALREARMMAIEKALDPPLGVLHDAVVGNGKVDTSARAINVINNKGRAGQSGNPIFPLYSVGEIREADKSVEDLTQSVKEHFMLDRFLDTNNNVQMTLGEVQLRNERTAKSMGSIFSRVIREVLTPTIERAVSIAWREKFIGNYTVMEDGSLKSDEVPEAVLNVIQAGGEFYEVSYFTPAARIMKAEEAQGILRSWEFAAQLAQARPDVLDNLNSDKSLEMISRISGAPDSILNGEKEVQQMREQRAAEQQAQAEAQQAAQQAELAKKLGEAESAGKEAPITQ